MAGSTTEKGSRKLRAGIALIPGHTDVDVQEPGLSSTQAAPQSTAGVVPNAGSLSREACQDYHGPMLDTAHGVDRVKVAVYALRRKRV